jgi:uncharacterized Rmd1/YagE family protein
MPLLFDYWNRQFLPYLTYQLSNVSSSDDFKMSGDAQKPHTAISLQSAVPDTPNRFELGFGHPMVRLLYKITSTVFYISRKVHVFNPSTLMI